MNDPAQAVPPEAPTPTATASEKKTHYSLSEVKNSDALTLARLAPGMKEAALAC